MPKVTFAHIYISDFPKVLFWPAARSQFTTLPLWQCGSYVTLPAALLYFGLAGVKNFEFIRFLTNSIWNMSMVLWQNCGIWPNPTFLPHMASCVPQAQPFFTFPRGELEVLIASSRPSCKTEAVNYFFSWFLE